MHEYTQRLRKQGTLRLLGIKRKAPFASIIMPFSFSTMQGISRDTGSTFGAFFAVFAFCR